MVELADTEEWHRWLPRGVCSLADARDLDGDVLLSQDPDLLACVEDFFRGAQVCTLCPFYAAQFDGFLRYIEDERPERNIKYGSFNEYTRMRVGCAMIGLTDLRVRTREQVADLFLGAVPSANNNTSGKWIGSLFNWICDDDELLLRERSDSARVSDFVGHSCAAI